MLTDIRMPPSSSDEGIRLARELRSAHPRDRRRRAEPARGAGLRPGAVRARIRPPRVPAQGAAAGRVELGRALREVAAGGSVVDPRIVDELLCALGRPGDAGLEKLTPREREILALVAEGRSNSAIADALVITKRAVERHINAIFAKLELSESEDVSRRVKATLLYLSGQDGVRRRP